MSWKVVGSNPGAAKYFFLMKSSGTNAIVLMWNFYIKQVRVKKVLSCVDMWQIHPYDNLNESFF